MRWCLSSCIFDDKMRHLKDFIAYSDSVVNNIASDSVTRLVNSNVMWNRIGNDQTRGAMSQRANSNQWECSVPFLSRARLRHASIIFFQVVLFFLPSFSFSLPAYSVPDMPPNTSRYQHTNEDTTNIPPNESLHQLIEATPFIDYEVASSSLFDGAFTIVSTIFPSWQRDDLKLVQCKDGITNQCM